MRILGEKIFAKDAEGHLLTRIGTMFFRTPGLVTTRSVHAMQRMMWLDEVNSARAAAGEPPLTPEEEEEELSQSVDLIFTDDAVLIRPDPERMDLAILADEVLRTMVSKRQIRFLNTSSGKVRAALCDRGENWRMARNPISDEDMTMVIERSRESIECLPVYYYNRATGTRFITAGGYLQVAELPDVAYRRQIKEVVDGLNKRNRLGHPEVDLFPLTTPIEIKKSLRGLPITELSDIELRRAVDKIATDWRASLPPELRDETTANYDWRNAMCQTITRQPNDTAADERELVSGIAAEFYRQIEWLPGARIVDGELIFDELYEEAARTQDPELMSLCDSRAKALIFHLTRVFGAIDFINIGRIASSLSRKPNPNGHRGNLYIIQYRDTGAKSPKMMILRFQKWGVKEHLDEGKDLMRAMLEADEYSDYILDRRLMCRQLGMNLPKRIGFGHFTEKYRGHNQYNGITVRTGCLVRPYIRGVASDKIQPPRYRNPAFALKFAKLMGAAAAVDLIVGRRSSSTHEILFDHSYEIVLCGDDGLPNSVKVTDHVGSFVDYESELVDGVADYAEVVRSRRALLPDYDAFADAYVCAFAEKLAEVQASYRSRRRAFDGLFADRPFDTNGSGAYRWARALARLDRANPEAIRAKLAEAVAC
jgi:hypothetical protein